MLLVSVISRYFQGMISCGFISGCYLVWTFFSFIQIKKVLFYKIFITSFIFAFIEQDSERQEKNYVRFLLY